jgi:hypothetical protein
MLAAHDRRRLLQLIIDDPVSTTLERAEARKALGSDSTPQPRRYGRNSRVPPTQADVDADIQNHFRNLHDDRLDAQARRDIQFGLDVRTQAILDAFWRCLVALSTVADSQLLADLYYKTDSDFVRNKAAENIRVIAVCSPDNEARRQAQEFLTQIDQEK